MFSLARLAAFGSLLFAVVGCQGLPPAAPAKIGKGDYAAVVNYLAERIPYEMGVSDVPGVSIAIVADQRIVWSTGFGYADAARHRRASGDTLYRVGAISKVVTAAAVLRAADEGLLSLDRPAGDALADWRVEPRRDAAQWMDAAPFTARTLLDVHAATLEDTMGRARADMAYALLGDMVAQSAREPLDVYVRRTIFRPLNMPRAGFEPHERMVGHRAAGYRRGQPWKEAPQPNAAADGLWMSASEMARFSAMLFGQGRSGADSGATRVLSERSVQALLALETVAGSGLDLNCRLALSWLAAPCGDALVTAASLREHSGATEAFHSRWVIDPREKLAVLVMSNADSGEALVGKVATLSMRLMREARQGR
ncbi:serine hydrolase [Achromobacter mucicolens]|uniref:serine hydrolase domain-containing protein n=1 Tax=Achromobacter mucicolens TaxID=1389922 RepID=UPI000D3AEA0E|nr:serine hydrolase domain-containing protein [Achromobacter mucicolens]PTW98963.1 serine hydrolase [Achromobacter mucicolens]